MAKAIYGSHKIPFFVSSNEVILSPGLAESGAIPTEYFRSVVDLQTNQYLH